MSLDFESAYNLHCGITLSDGRSVTLRSIEQRMTYEGLLEGYPATAQNDHLIDQSIQRAGGTASVYLIEPARRPHLRPTNRAPTQHEIRRPPEWLPMIECVGRFSSFPAARDPSAHGSELTILWYQDEFAMPVANNVLSHIREVAWNKLAKDFEL